MAEKSTSPSEKQDTISIDDINKHIEQERAERKKKSAVPDGKMKKVDVYKVIHASMKKKGRLQQFPTKFHVKRDMFGEHQYLEELDNQVVRFVSKQRIIDTMAQYSDGVSDPNFDLTPGKAKECMEYWASLYPSFDEEIAIIRQKSEPGYTFYRLPFDFKEGKTPLFDALMSRTSNARALMAWIGSLFVFDSDRQSYVWIYGEGQNGKGTLARFLSKCLGAAARWDQPPSKDDKFWTSGLLGKRLVVFGDCNNYGFPISGLFKSLTGGDLIRVEEKGRPSTTVELGCKFLFLSNDTPLLSSQKSDMRRAIFCKMQPIPKEKDIGPNYEDYLWYEAPHILEKCLDIYLTDTFTTGGRIVADMSEVEAIASENEEPYAVLLQTRFALTTDHNLHHKDRSYVHPIHMQKVLKDEGLRETRQQKNFLRYLKERHGVEKVNVTIDKGLREWRYLGLRELSNLEREQQFSVYQ